MPAVDRIEVNSRVMLGKPVIRGTRIPVEMVLRKLSEGAREGDLFDAYPRLTREDIQAVLAYAADTVAHEAKARSSLPHDVVQLVAHRGADLVGRFVVMRPGRVRMGPKKS
ncbi:MAG: DUF433 domain-containing protein [Candidatus Saccharimonadales bacterium]